MQKNLKKAQGLVEYLLIFGVAAIIGALILSPTAMNTSTGIVNSSVQRQDTTLPASNAPIIIGQAPPTIASPTAPTISQPTLPLTTQIITSNAPPCPCPSISACQYGSTQNGTQAISGANCTASTCPKYTCNPPPVCTCPSVPTSCTNGYITSGTEAVSGANCLTATCTKYICKAAPKEVVSLSSIDTQGSKGWQRDGVQFYDLIDGHIWFTDHSEAWARVQSDFQNMFSTSPVVNLAQRVKDSMVSFFESDSAYKQYTDRDISFNPYDVTLMEKTGGYSTISWNTFITNTKINGVSFNTWIASNKPTSTLEDDIRAVLSNPGYFPQPPPPDSWIDYYIITNKALYNATTTATAMNAVQNSNIIYANPSTGDEYKVSTGFFSPVKVSLTPKNAQINSNHRFLFDLDGFKANSRLPIVTAGGLNPDEAWLINDRSGNSLFFKGALDGEDVFGDHLGKYKSGYEDLAQLYSKYIKTDELGKRYIEIKSLSLLDRIVIVFNRIFRIDTNFNPSYDLKLITRENKAIPASKILSRIYVDYDLVNEYDKAKLNWIGQRAMVVYKNGEKAKSADQWFKALTLTPVKYKNSK